MRFKVLWTHQKKVLFAIATGLFTVYDVDTYFFPHLYYGFQDFYITELQKTL